MAGGRQRCGLAYLKEPAIQIDERSLEGSILDRLDAVAGMQPEHQSISAPDGTASYRELCRDSRLVASSLLIHAEQPQSIGLFFDRGINHFAAMLGALRCGHRFVPLEPSYPADRLRHMIDDGGCRIVITEARQHEVASRVCGDGVRVLAVEDLLRQGDEARALPRIAPDALAMIMYTSGSTGKPKGVVHSHLSLLQNCLRRSRAVGLHGDHRTAQLEPASYVPAVTVALLTLMNGSTLCPFRVQEEGISALVRWLNTERISMMRANPTLLRAILAGMGSGSQFPHLRGIQTGGEPVRSSDLRMFYEKRLPNCSLFISYGSTESGIIAIHRCHPDDVDRGDPVPVGAAVEGVVHEIVDEAGNVLPIAAEGEIAPRSAYFSLGYWNRDEETARIFERSPQSTLVRYHTGDVGRIGPDGLLYHLGRRDQQVKVRGHRIECGEIESIIMACLGVIACAVAPFVDAEGETRLAAYIVAEEPDASLEGRLRHHLSTKIAAFALPAVFIPMGALPISPNAKLDRSRLPDPIEWMNRASAAIPASRATGGSNEAIRRTACLLSDVWQDVLRCPRPQLDDSFFRMGGDSLSAMQVCLELESRYSLRLPITRVFEADTIRKQAALLSDETAIIRSEPLVVLQQGTGNTGLLCIPGIAGHAWMFRHLAAALGPEVTVIGANFPGLDTTSQPLDRIEDLADYYINSPLKALLNCERLAIGGYSFGGLIAYEIARRLERSGAPPHSLLLWDCFHPRSPAADHWILETKRRLKRTLHIRPRGRSPLEAQFAAVADGCRIAAARYRNPLPTAISTVFSMTAEERARRRRPADAGGWRRSCTGPFRSRLFTSQHIDLFRMPAVLDMAAAVREDLGLDAMETPGSKAEGSARQVSVVQASTAQAARL